MLKLVKSNELKVDKVYTYIGSGYMVSDKEGKRKVSKGVHYEARVIQITPHIIAMRIKADQSTLNRMCIWDSIPYNWSISRIDLDAGREYLYEEVYR